jgi:hypothetical protein
VSEADAKCRNAGFDKHPNVGDGPGYALGIAGPFEMKIPSGFHSRTSVPSSIGKNLQIASKSRQEAELVKFDSTIQHSHAITTWGGTGPQKPIPRFSSLRDCGESFECSMRSWPRIALRHTDFGG